METLSDSVLAERKALFDMGSKYVEPKGSGVYCWYNLISNKRYIGISIDLRERHNKFLRFDTYYAGRKINNARRKYDNEKYWCYCVLEYCDNIEEQEPIWISALDSVKNGYNTSVGGEQSNLKYATEEERKAARAESEAKYRKANAEKINQHLKEYRKANAEKINQHLKEYRKANAEKIKQKRKEYRKANAEKISQQHKKYRNANAEKIKQKRKEYRKANAEKISQQRKEYRNANAEKVTQLNKEYRKANAERIRAQAAEYRAKHTEKIKQHNKEYRKANSEKISQHLKEYRKANAEKIKARNHAYYLRKKAERAAQNHTIASAQ